MTLDTYAALWEQAKQAERVTGMIEHRFGESIGQVTERKFREKSEIATGPASDPSRRNLLRALSAAL